MTDADRQADAAPLGERLSADHADLIMRELEALPTLPAVATRLLALTAGGDARSGGEPREEVIRLIGADQALTARLLSLVNVAARRPARTVAEAVERLGFEAARSAALSIKVFDTFGRRAAEPALGVPAFWRHCLAVACAAELLAPRTAAGAPPQVAFVCGLLHDIGKLALDHCLPKTYLRVLEALQAGGGNIADYERRIIGVDHTVFGRRLAERWRLPEAVQEVVWLHHQPFEALPASLSHRPLIATVALADAVARRRRFGFSGNDTFPRSPEQMGAALGVGAAALEDVARRLPGAIEQRARPLGLDDADGESLYREALAEANAELGRLNEALRRRAGAMEARSQALAHLGTFAASLHPEATVGEMLRGVGAVVAAACGHTPSPEAPIVAYSVTQEPPELLAVRHDGSATAAWRTAAAAEGFEPAAHAPAGAAEALAALLADPQALAGWLVPERFTHKALVCAGRWIGGVFAPADAPAAGEQAIDGVASSVALALAIAQGRARAVRLSEQLAGASQVLAETQDALAEAKTLAAVGAMAAGAAHELNNPLAVISGRAQLMRDRAATDADGNAWRLIAEQAQRISDILSELMELASPPEPRPQHVSVVELLEQAAKSFAESDHPQAGAAEVDITVEGDPPPVRVDPAQLCRALRELIANGTAAAAGRPRVRLAARYDELDDAVLVTVTDNGPGMDARTAENAFTPFFSVQQAGRRTGMGLPRARRYVEINGGRIWLRRPEGEGTTVCLRLPAAGTKTG